MSPLYSAIQQMRIAGVVIGQGAGDFGLPVNRALADPEDVRPFRFITPLWSPTRHDVERRVAELGVRLPKHYSEISDSLECWCCAESYPDRAEWMERAYPEFAQIAGPIFRDIAKRTIQALKPKTDVEPINERDGND